MDCYLGLDFGTTSVKVTAMDHLGQVIAKAHVPCSTISPEPGWFEVDAEAMWRGGLLKSLRAIDPQVVRTVRAICISSVCASFVPVDDGLDPIYNAILYGIDTRAAEQVDRLNARYAQDVLARVSGSGFTSHSVPPKLLWLKERLPGIYERTSHFLESSNFVTSWLTGEVAWDAPSAAGGHMLDMEKGAYPLDLLGDMGLDSRKLPPLANPLDVLGRVSARAAAKTGLPEGASVLVGACDVNAEAFACAAVDPGELTFVYGSTVSTLFILDRFKSIPGFITGPSVLGGTYRVGGATSSGGRYLDWVRKLLRMEGIPKISSTSLPSGLLMVPFLDGARTPNQNPDARVLWYGMDSSTSQADLWKAAIEGMGCELFRLLQRLKAAAPLPQELHAMGGLASNRDFLQIACNIMGIGHRHFSDIDASYGDCLMALSVDRGLETVRSIWTERLMTPDGEAGNCMLVEPEAGAFERYALMREKYAMFEDTALRLA